MWQNNACHLKRETNATCTDVYKDIVYSLFLIQEVVAREQNEWLAGKEQKLERGGLLTPNMQIVLISKHLSIIICVEEVLERHGDRSQQEVF